MIDVKKAIEQADNLNSKIDTQVMSELRGLSSPRVRHLLNNLAAQAKTYLEIGCYIGGTLRAAIHGNEHLKAYAIDNFSMSPETRGQFFENTKGLNFEFFEEDSYSLDIKKIKQPIDLYFFDGCHSVDAQYKAVSYFLPAMADEFVMVIDDWDANKVQVGTNSALIDLKIKPVERYELKGATGDERENSWWGGIGILKIRK